MVGGTGNPNWKKGGPSPNPKGRPKGIIDKRQRMQQALMNDGDALLAVVKARAMDGDMNAAALLLPRLIPALKPEGAPVRFAFDPSLSLMDQFNALMVAISSGQLTIEEGQKLADMLRAQAEIAALEGKGDEAERLVRTFRDMAQAIAERETGQQPLQAGQAAPAITTLAAPESPPVAYVCPPAPPER